MGASWVPSGCLLGASWVSPDGFWCLLVLPGCLQMLPQGFQMPQFPPYLRCVTDALDRIPFWFEYFDNKSHWKWKSKSLEMWWQMEPKWRHKSVKCDKIVKQIHAASHEPKHAHINGKPSSITYHIKFDFDVLACTGAQFALFHNWSDCDLIGSQRPAKSNPGTPTGAKR